MNRTATRIALELQSNLVNLLLWDALPSLNHVAENLSDLGSELLETAEELPLPESFISFFALL